MAASKKVLSFVLPEGAIASSEPQTFGGIPGLYVAGQPVALSTLELTEEEARALIEGKNVPLKIVEAAPETGKPVAGLDREQLRDLADEHQIEVTRAEGEGDPTKGDYLRVLGEAGIDSTSPDSLPIAGRHYDEASIEPGESIPALPPNGRVASALEGHWPDGSPMLTAEQAETAGTDEAAEAAS